ncbi:MAG: hypothetical protein ACI4IJ_06725, partial [Acutalibacteraceae bacterium]
AKRTLTAIQGMAVPLWIPGVAYSMLNYDLLYNIISTILTVNNQKCRCSQNQCKHLHFYFTA